LTWWRGIPATAEDEPWTVRPAWRTREIPEAEAAEWLRILLAGVFNAIAWPFTIGMLYNLQGMTSSDLTTLDGLRSAFSGGNWVGYLILLLLPACFLCIATYYGWMAGRDTLRWLRFGTSTLVLDPMPARLGRPMQARLRTSVDPDDAPEEGFHVELACYEPVHSTNSNRERREVWSEEAYVEGTPGARADRDLEVPVSFDIPSSLPPSPAARSSNQIEWEVRVHADLPGPDYEATFEIPVFEPDE
jgi:hypothetical protein